MIAVWINKNGSGRLARSACAASLTESLKAVVIPVDRRRRRLRLHGLIERVPKSHRYRMTDGGWRTILFCTPCRNCLLRPGLSEVVPEEAESDTTLRRCLDQLNEAITQKLTEQRLAA